MILPVHLLMARALELDEVEPTEILPLSPDEQAEAHRLGVPVPDDTVQRLIPGTRLIVRHDIVARRAELAALTGERP